MKKNLLCKAIKLFIIVYLINSEKHVFAQTPTPQMVFDINPGANGTNIYDIKIANRNLYIVGDDPIHGRELWKYDVAEDTAYIIKDIYPGTNWSFNGGMQSINNRIYFTAEDGVNGNEFWIHDPIEDTTYFKDINPLGDSYPGMKILYNGNIYFNANDGTENELWIYEVGNDTVYKFKDLNPSGSSYPQEFVSFKGKLYFAATDGVHGHELWVYDHVADTAFMIKDANVGSASSLSYTNYITAGQKNIFMRGDHCEMMRYNIEEDSLYIMDFNASGTTYFYRLLSFKDRILCIGDNGSGIADLHVYDETLDTMYVFRPNGISGSNINIHSNITENDVYLTINDGIKGKELWRYNYENDTIYFVHEFNPTGDSNPYNVIPYGNKVLLVATDDVTGNEFKLLNLDDDSVLELNEINPSTSYETLQPTAIQHQGVVYFSATDGVNGIELWKIQIADLDTITVDTCAKYISPSGDYVWYESGVKEDRLKGQFYDTLVTVNLTINRLTKTLNESIDEGNSYVSPSGIYTYTNAGTYKDTLVTAAGCDSIITINLSKNPSTVSIKDNLKHNSSIYKIYPNPTTGIINILNTTNIKTEVKVRDLAGREIINTRITSESSTIDLSNFDKGVYIIELFNEQEKVRFKIIKD